MSMPGSASRNSCKTFLKLYKTPSTLLALYAILNNKEEVEDMQDYPYTASMTLAEQLGQLMVVGFQ
jgi:hypothetical protein